MGLFEQQKFLLKVVPEPGQPVAARLAQHHFLWPTFRLYSSHNRGYTVAAEDGVFRLRVGDVQLKGFELVWDERARRLTVTTDRLSLYPLMVMASSDGGLLFSNTTKYFPVAEPNWRFSPGAVNRFLVRGSLPPDSFLIDGVHRISGRWTHVFGEPLRTGSCRWNLAKPLSDEEASPKRTRDAFLESLSFIVKAGEIDEFWFSGGADTRMVYFGLKEIGATIPPVKIISPYGSDPERDLDLQVATRFCQKMDQDYEVVRQERPRAGYFSSSQGKAALSGLYGGDLLGGFWQYTICGSPAAGVPERALTTEYERKMRQEGEEIGWLSAFEQDLLGQQLMTHSERSLFFLNYNHGWASPLSNMRVSISPFAVAPFVEHAVSVPQSQRLNYKHYFEVLRMILGQDDFPLCSYLTHFHPQYSPPRDWGENPKAFSWGQPLSGEQRERLLWGIMDLLAERGVDIERTRCEALFKDRIFQMALMGLRGQFRAYLPEAPRDRGGVVEHG